MTRIEILYRIDLLTPLHIGTGMGFAQMIDDMVVRAGPAKGEGGRLPCIPGSSIKGKARNRCEALARAMNLKVCGERKCKANPCVICRIFGSPFNAGGLQFSDALLPIGMNVFGQLPAIEPGGDVRANPFALSTTRTGNKLERVTRTAAREFLFSTEQTSEDIEFEGMITGFVDSNKIRHGHPELLDSWLLVVGLQTVDKIGGQRSRGLGRCRIAITKFIVEGRELDTSSGGLTKMLQ